MPTKPFTLRLPDEVRDDLQFLSSSLKRSQSAIAAEMLVAEITEKARRTRAIQEALEESRKGEFVSQEAVEKWVASIGTDSELPMPESDVFSKPG